MMRCVRLPTARLFRLWLLNLYAVLLVGLALANLAPLPSAGAGVNVVQRTRTPTLTATSPLPSTVTSPAGTFTGADDANTDSAASPAQSWVGKGVALAVFIVVGFGLIMVPIAVRSTRIDKRALPAYPLPHVAEKKQMARLSRVAPVRREPLPREQLQALRDAARGNAVVSQPSARALATIRLVAGLPVSLPSSGGGTTPQLSEPQQPVVTHGIESDAEEETSGGQA